MEDNTDALAALNRLAAYSYPMSLEGHGDSEADYIIVRDALAAAHAKPAIGTPLLNLCEAIVRDAVPATDSGATCFVPRYQIDRLGVLLGGVGCGAASQEGGE